MNIYLNKKINFHPFSSESNVGKNNSNINPVFVYNNCDTQKDQIFEENKDKIVIYR